VDEAADSVSSLNRDVRPVRRQGAWVGRDESERAVRQLGVVVLDMDPEDALEVATVEDQEPVEALGADGAHEPLGDRVRPGRADIAAGRSSY
jgi:DNA-binding IclR family transcriptional regulator